MSSMPKIDVQKLAGPVASGAVLPLAIAIYYAYVPASRWAYGAGVAVTFLCAAMALFCRCDTQTPRTAVVAGVLFVYALVAMYISINLPKKSKLRHMLLNTLVQYSVYFNVFLLVTRGLSK